MPFLPRRDRVAGRPDELDKRGAGGTAAAALLRRDARHTVKLGSFKNGASGKHPRLNFKSSEVSLSLATRSVLVQNGTLR